MLLSSSVFHSEILQTPKGLKKKCIQIRVHSVCHDILWVRYVQRVLYPPSQHHTEEFHFLKKKNHLCFACLSLCPPQTPGNHGSLYCFCGFDFSNGHEWNHTVRGLSRLASFIQPYAFNIHSRCYVSGFFLS